MSTIGIVAELWDIKQAAEYLGMHVMSLRKHKSQGTGPSYLTLGPNGGLLRYRKCDLDAWVESRTISAKPTRARLKHIRSNP